MRVLASITKAPHFICCSMYCVKAIFSNELKEEFMHIMWVRLWKHAVEQG